MLTEKKKKVITALQICAITAEFSLQAVRPSKNAEEGVIPFAEQIARSSAPHLYHHLREIRDYLAVAEQTKRVLRT